MKTPYEYVIPAIRGLQAGREYFTSMFPLRLVPRLLRYDDEVLPAEVRAQRTLNKARIPELRRYILDNPDSYCFSAITASVDSEMHFEPIAPDSEGQQVGKLHIPMAATFILNDGQHRRKAIEEALVENPDLGFESIPVVLFLDVGRKRCQQMFADLNRYAVRPSRSLGILYDHRDDLSQLVKDVIFKSPTFRDIVEVERSNIPLRSRKLFTLSSFYTAIKKLLTGLADTPLEERIALATEYWEAVAQQFPEWQDVRDRKLSAKELRSDFIHSSGTVLQSLGRVGNALLQSGKPWKRQLGKLRDIDWSRKNTKLWEGRTMIGGRISKAGNNVTLTTNLIKKRLNLPLTAEEKRTEKAYKQGSHG